jgi:two-component system chemotaxis response regulator CheV
VKPVLQVGSNLFEMIEFTVTKGGAVPVPVPGRELAQGKPATFGVNVAKVREVIRLPHIVPCLTTSPEVLGVFNLRGLPIPAIHLAMALGFSQEPVSPGSYVIVTEFSRRLAGFIVTSTRRIRRVSWDKVLPPSSEAFNTITGMMLVENNEFLFILDFEKILAEIEGHTASNASVWNKNDSHSQRSPEIAIQDPIPIRKEKTGKPLVMVVDDSPTMRKAISEMLRGIHLDVVEFQNGEQAWNALNDTQYMNGPKAFQIVISDVEMPRLDGYSLVKRIRNHPALKDLPVILHSSLTGEVNKERAKEAGADAYVAKFNKREIVEALKSILPQGWASEVG